MLRRKKKQKTQESDAFATFAGLRATVLSEAATTITATPGAHPDVVGVVVDIPQGADVATLVSLADGTTSLYTSTGGGIVGGGGHPTVVEASTALLTEVQETLELFPVDDRLDLPPPDMVQLTAITPTHHRLALIPATAFWGQEPSGIVNLIAAVQHLMTALRQASPPR